MAQGGGDDPLHAAAVEDRFREGGSEAVHVRRHRGDILLTELFKLGAQRQNLVAKVAGAGSPLGKEETFRIGQRNYTILRKLLWKNNVLIEAEDIGGSKARTMYLYMHDGLVTVKSEGKEVPL